ncbi:MAG TPA: YkgJ family cysteine cluster protein [Kofleriaceae bacterium]
MSRYPELAAKVDAFFARVQARHGEDIKCGTGCHHCCHVRLSVTQVEADAIRAEVASWPNERKDQLTANAAFAPPGRCSALDEGGRCLIYQVRPIVCRSHGAPIRMRNENSLPVVQACVENFTTAGPAAADPDCIIDQTTLSAMVLAVDRDAGHDGERIDLAVVLAGC